MTPSQWPPLPRIQYEARVSHEVHSLIPSIHRLHRMTALYNAMEAAEIPEEIIDTIARRAHKNSFNEGLKEAIETYMTPLERACRDHVPFTDILREHVETVFVDDAYCWITVILKLKTGTYVVYHYHGGRGSDFILAEVAVEKNAFHMIRFYYERDDDIVFHDIASYKARGGFTCIPFQFLAEVAQMQEEYPPIKQTSQARWRHRDDLAIWFSSHEADFIELTEA